MSEHKKKSLAKDVFSYLLMIGMLIASVVAFGTILFEIINDGFPDVLNKNYYANPKDAIRDSISTLVIVWPVFLLLSWMIGKELLKHREKAEIWIRKWLLYLTLFVSAIVVIVDLITLINFFLDGEITTRFILKVLVALVMAVVVFWYYLWELKRDTSLKSTRPKITAIISSIAVLAVIVGGFFVVGSPKTQRMVRLDLERVQDLSNIQSQIVFYWQEKGELPKQLDDLSDSVSGYKAPTDPITKSSYNYKSTSKLEFELCAVFDLEAESEETEGYPIRSMEVSMLKDYDPRMENWDHDAGKNCFLREIDPDIYGKN